MTRSWNTHLLRILYLFCSNSYQLMTPGWLSRKRRAKVWTAGVRIAAHIIHTGSETYAASYRMGTAGPFSRGKAAEVWAEVKNCEAIIFQPTLLKYAYVISFLPVSVSPLTLLGNGSINTFPRQRIHKQQQKNCWKRRYLYFACHIINLLS
jgi:hypothetical protein